MQSIQGRLRLERGGLYIGSSRERYILIPMRAYAEIINTMFELAGKTAGGPLYYLGKNIGRSLAKELLRRAEKTAKKTLPGIVEEYARLLEELGFGKVRVLEASNNHSVILMENTPSIAGAALADGAAERLARGDGKICYLEAGMAAGVLEELLNTRFHGAEVEHGTPERPYCVIEVRKAGSHAT